MNKNILLANFFDKQITHVLITYTGGKYEITAVQEALLRNLSDSQNIEINGSIIKGKNIAEVVAVGKYYADHPEQERKQHVNYDYPDAKLLPAPEKFTKDKALNALRSMLRGLISQIEATTMTDGKLRIMQAMNAKIDLLEATPEENIHLTTQELIGGLV